MKLFIFVSILLATFTVKAQMPVPGGYEQDAYINKFAGTWQWTSGTDTVKIVLQKQKIFFTSANCSYDVLVGWHKFVKNGITVENDLQNVGIQWTTLNHKTASSLLGFSKNETAIYFTTFRDYVDNKVVELIFTLLPNSLTQAKWRLRNSRGIHPGNYNNSFTIPKDLILTKQ